MAKQHVFNHVLRHGGAVKADKRTVGTGRGLVQHAREHFLARTGRAFNQYGHVGQGYAVGQGQQIAADGVHIDHAAYLLLGGDGMHLGGWGVHCRTGNCANWGVDGLACGACAGNGLGPGASAPVVRCQRMAGTSVYRRNRGLKVAAFGAANHGQYQSAGFDQRSAIFQQADVGS